ncbi:MAG: YihY/virulence factor BrkB family protein [Clostridia bacterium]|nr:YihY/virulence factor BrkB family protein [Clostridia bacterium]
MKSKVIAAAPFSRIKKIISLLSADRLPLFAAQSSFFICISAIPFIMLVVAIARAAFPELTDDLISVARAALPESTLEIFDVVVSDVTDRDALPLISTAAISTLWASSRGLNAVVNGVSEVYGKRGGGSALVRIIKSVLYTALFIIVIVAALVALVFGKYLKDAMTSSIGEVPMFIRYKEVIIFFLFTLFFSLLYYLVARGAFTSPFFKWERRTPEVKLTRQFPGAALAALGWILFSFFYSLYFEAFPKFSYLYGSLAAIVFLMLWMYFCILILLAGAEVNKLINEKRKKRVSITKTKS